MPLVQALPTWVALNNANFTSPSGMADPVTNFPYQGGALNLGDYFDITNEQAATASNPSIGLLYSGRYRYVQVDSGATAANVKTGTVGFLRAGTQVKSVVLLTAGSGQTAGTYNISATAGSGGGSGAVIQVVVTAAGTVTAAPTVLFPGFNYSSVPTFTMPTAAGGTGATFGAQLNTTPNLVTSADQTTVTGVGAVRPVVYLNSITPGNYGFVQELGTATVLNAVSTVQTAGQAANVTSSTGIMTTSTTAVSNTSIGAVIDAVASVATANIPFKIQMGFAAMTVQD